MMRARARTKKKTRIFQRDDSTHVPFTMEECYDIFRNIFHNKEDARAAVLQLFGGESWGEEFDEL